MPESLAKPSAKLVSSHIERFDSEKSGRIERAIGRLFALFPKNSNEEEVLLKVTTINSLYSTNIYAIYEVAQHILQLKIDPLLTTNSLDAVEKIAPIRINGKVRKNLSFASKYCSFHKPEVYPINDQFVRSILLAYRDQDKFLDFPKTDLWQYTKYKRIIERFREHYGLPQFSIKEIDKFLWRYARKLFYNP